jgi:hypothetical protein
MDAADDGICHGIAVTRAAVGSTIMSDALYRKLKAVEPRIAEAYKAVVCDRAAHRGARAAAL